MLPFLKNTNVKSQKQLVAFRGLNLTDRYQDGNLADCMNLSFRRFPYLSTRRDRVKHGFYEGATAMTARDKLVIVQGTKLLYDGEAVDGEVTEGEKQFAVVNTKMVIWPDKVYLDMTDKKIKPLGASVGATGVKFSAEHGTMTVTGDIKLTEQGTATKLTEQFRVGDGVHISGTKQNNRAAVILDLTDTVLTIGMKNNSNPLIDEEVAGTVTIERRIPDLDFICESDNRLWGCSNSAQSIYVSAWGDPTNFFVNEGASTDSWTVAVGTEGEFTGCCKLTSSMLFWKETKLHKLLGSYPAEYAVYTYDIEGLQKGCHKSLQVINETLYYVGLHGVYTYTGGVPNLISAELGDQVMYNAVAGTDGDSYYLSVDDGHYGHLMVYDLQNRMWTREDGGFVNDFARIGKDLYFLSYGVINTVDSREDDPEVRWIAQFCPFYETIQGRKRYTKILLRVELPKGSWMRAEVRFNGGNWIEIWRVYGRSADVIPLQVPINRCDRFELKLDGEGPCTILAMQLEYQVGSEM